MATIKELIRTEAAGGLSFGNYELDTKSKLSDFEYNGDLYKVKTFRELTRLERNEMFVYESVPGTTVLDMKLGGNGMVFFVEGTENTQVTVELEPDTEYKVIVDDVNLGNMKTNLGGKLSFSVDLNPGTAVKAEIEKL
ncbi:MAG: endosialidase [Clostridiales bacterium]|uniref:Endosialidase n=1 Tax=Candidatus Pullilachnospira stercoravium TaxID=2840913 RepID=A0A9D1NSQ3_9FIRM|nr:endosialidase [Clostridiales bacterium]HIV12274.1 endosialidase [Candidatus Pullilachnospira stercoravium]